MNRPRPTSARRRSAAGRAQPASSTEDHLSPLLDSARLYAESFRSPPPRGPVRRVAIVTCMDARIDPVRLLGLAPGDAHVLRNAGGVVTDDVIRSLAISQQVLGTEAVMLILHTGCGMQELASGTLERALQERTGLRPAWSVEGFQDVDTEVRQSLGRLESSPFVMAERARGFVYDPSTGELREVV